MNFSVVVNDFLWFAVIFLWIVLIWIGLEADRPMSGGLPGHSVDLSSHHGTSGPRDWGEIGGWMVFGLAFLSLVLILWYVYVHHVL